jgi:hypothetical protein
MAKVPTPQGVALAAWNVRGLKPRFSRPAVRDLGKIGSENTPFATVLAPFHTTGDVMAVILRIGVKSNSNTLPKT